MIKKILAILVICLLGGYVVFAAFFFKTKPEEAICNYFHIEIDNATDDKFIEVKQLEKFIDKKGLNPYGKQLKEINTYKIQEAILENQLIKSAEVFVTNDGGIRAIIKERIPIMRVIAQDGQNYYIDKSGERMPLSDLNTAYVPIVTGNVKEEFAKAELYKFALFLSKNEFWNAQIDQIYVKSNNDLILESRVGDHQIEIGSLDNFEEKLQRLKTFYLKALSETGWNRYTKINLKYDNQVIGTKR